jgi:hypothetical protein
MSGGFWRRATKQSTVADLTPHSKLPAASCAAHAGLNEEGADDDWWEYDALTLVEKTPR